ncbi:putative LPS assembly protein LptD [Rubrivirga sp. IMCC45206]|uniref:putative LPS assembly protein LptD n=1 Tax=Rubrivirga sp. IMCC45206 TaxID=3391614 RepID=UPI003990282F
MVRALLLLLLSAASASAQRADSLAVRPDTLDAPADSLTQAPREPARQPLVLGVPRAPAAEGGLDRAIRYTAVDSIRVVLAPRGAPEGGPGDVVSLFGNVQTEYEGATISAGRVDYETANEVLRAGPVRSDSGDVGLPSYSGEQGQFTGRSFVYDLRSQRGRVTGAKTVIEDGYLLGGILKQKDEHVVFAQNAAYTTCELDHPHYAVEAGRMKIVDGERVYTGPVQLKLLGLPMPVLLPFGYFPTADGRRSGPLPVKYGSDSSYGLFLENLGWYWALSDYLDAQVTGKIGTQGSVQAQGQVRYNKRYAYNGSVSLQLARLRSGESTDPDFSPRTPAGLRWTHNQTLPAGQRVTASVNLQSAGLRLATSDVSEQRAVSTSSNVSFSQSWPTVGRSVNVSLQAYQDFGNNRTTAQLPSLQFSQQRRFPFRRGRDDNWWEKISVSYTANAQNAFAFEPSTDSTGVSAFDALFSADSFRRAACPLAEPDCDLTRFDYQVVQTVPVSASFSVPRFNLSFGPSLNLTETWTDEETTRVYVDSLGRAVAGTASGFTAFRRVSASASASTELYGTFPIRVGALDGVRHTLTPSVSMSFEPDYEAFGYVREVQSDSLGGTERYAINPSIPIDPTRTLSFSVQNAFTGRFVRADSTGEETRQTRQLLSLSLTGGYNFGAETNPLSPVSARFTTSLFGLNASGSAAFNPYGLDSLGRLSPLTYYETAGRPLRLTNVNLQVNRTFQSGRRTGGRDVRPVYNPSLGDLYDATSTVPRSAAIGYVDYSAPWSAALGLTLNRSTSGIGEPRTVATLDVSQLNARLTQNWSVTGSTGVDLTSMELTTTRLGLRRDLHCWEMAINWQPIGITKLFSVSLYVKSGFLRDFLRLDVPNSTVRTGGFGQSF